MFRTLSIAALVAVFAQITFGSIVRVTDSGLGCPDWPLCHGRLIPPFEFETLIEYTHRLIGSLVGVLVVATALLAWLRYRWHTRLLVPAMLSLVLVFVAGILGGVTVLTELESWWRLVHLGVAEALAVCLAFVIVAGWQLGSSQGGEDTLARGNPRLGRMVIAAGAGLFLLIISGSYMIGEGAASSCATWPLCRGSIFPSGEPYLIHMAHRYIAALVGLHVLVACYAVWKRREQRPAIGWWAVALAASVILQVLLSVGLVQTGFDDALKVTHLSLATLTMVSVAYVAALLYTPVRLKPNRS